jgi:Schlafen, AlbA_2
MQPQRQTMNPFNKPISELKKEDIHGLRNREVAESLFIEFKAHVPNHLGKHVAAFANTRGGWCILGVEADPDTHLPIEFPGISKSEWPVEKIMDLVQISLDSMPFVHPQAIDVDGQNAIVVLKVDESPAPPHVYSDSRIYVRPPTGSDPVVEEDRQAINEMYKKGERAAAGVKAAFDATLWRTRFYPGNSQAADTTAEKTGFHFGLIACPKLMKPGLIPVFDDEEFLIRSGFAHEGNPRRRQHSITMEDETRNHQKFTEISSCGMIELNIHTRFRPQDRGPVSLQWVPLIVNFMDRAYRIYARVQYYGPVLFLVGLSGIEGRSISGHETGRQSEPSRRNGYEILREYEGALRGGDNKRRAEEIEDEIYRCCGEAIL